MELILASRSPYRAKQLKQCGLNFKSLSPTIDEEILKRKLSALPPEELCLSLAQAKAESIAKKYPDDIIIAGDQMALFKSQTIGKAGNIEAALKQLEQLSGHEHQLMTSLVVIFKGKVMTHINITRLLMRELSNEQLLDYLKIDKSWDCAGSYKFEQSGISLFKSVLTEDSSAIIGIPLIALNNILMKICPEKFFKPL